MNQPLDVTQSDTGAHLLLLHPTGSEDPEQTSLALGLLEWLRHGFEGRSMRCSFWPETASDSQGHRRFIMRTQPWKAAEIRRKLELVPTATAVLHLDLSRERTRTAAFAMEDRRGDRIGKLELPFDADGIYENLPRTLDELLVLIDLEPYGSESSELFYTTDRATALASLYALERVVALQAGVGREEPRRLFEPALQCLHRDGAHPIARECLVRLGLSLLATERPEDRNATLDAYERWSEIVPVSPVPPYYLALARQRSGQHEPARGAFEESLRRDPHYGPALQEYAVWLGERGFVEQGVAVLRQAFGRTNIDGALMDQAGCLLANAGRVREAEPLFRASIVAGGPHTAYANLARGLLAGGREEAALAILNEALASNPETAHIELLGELARGSGFVAAKARAMLRGGIVSGSEDELLVKELAAITLELDGAEAAAPQARRLLKISKSPEHRRFAYYILLRGKIPELDARWDKAVEDAVEKDAASAEPFFREVLEAEPEFGHAQFLLAASLERLDRLREALFYVEAAAASEEKDNAAVLDLLARARAEAGNLAGAAQAHHRAASLAPQNPRILRNAAISLLRAGYYYEGTGLAGASLALEPEQPELTELLRHAAAQREKSSRGVKGRFMQFVRRIRRAT